MRDQLVQNTKDDEFREKVLGKAQFEGKVPNLDQLIGIMKKLRISESSTKMLALRC